MPRAERNMRMSVTTAVPRPTNSTINTGIRSTFNMGFRSGTGGPGVARNTQFIKAPRGFK